MRRLACMAMLAWVVALPRSSGALAAETPPAGVSRTKQFNFQRDIMPILSRFGCNSSACHAKAEGQNGFKLSVFGYDPAADHAALTKEGRGRRVFLASPDHSLLLKKVSGELPHGGGARITADMPQFRTLRDWIAAGAPFGDADDPMVVRIELSPSERVLSTGAKQPLRVTAIYSDGHRQDVTALAQFQSNNDALVKVDEHGLVTVGSTAGQAAVMARFLDEMAVFRVLIPRPGKIASYPSLQENNFIDGHVHRQLKKLNIVPSELCDDADFMRRVYLDIIGTLPTADEARAFLADRRSDRRARLVDALLQRPEYADYWAMKWSDLLRVDRQALGHKGAYSYYRWIRQSLAANKPHDVMVRELLTAEGPLSESPQGQFYKVVAKPGDMASTLSQVFLGVRIACAECHHHPFDRWSQDDYYGMQAFFQQVGRKHGSRGEMLVAEGNPETKNPRTGKVVTAHPLADGKTGQWEAATVTSLDRRVELARWFTAAGNPWFAQNLANRLAAHFLGRGLIEPVDDVRDTNPPTNPELLAALTRHVVESKFDVKAVIRTITASRTYQLSSRPNETNRGDEQNYSRALLKRPPAEVLLDAICQTTGRGEKFAGVPAGYRAIQLWDSGVDHYFLTLFGRPGRTTACQCERNSQPSISQVLHLTNSPQIHAKLTHERGTVTRLVRDVSNDALLVEELYLTFFARYPSDEEKQAALDYLKESKPDRRQAAEDLAWSMLNSLEFLFNH